MKVTIRMLLLCCSLLLVSTSGHAVTVGQFLNPFDPTYADCSKADSLLKVLCTKVQADVNQRLQQAGLSIVAGNLVYKTSKTVNSVVFNTCTREVNWKSWTATTTLDKSASIRLSGNAISEPAIFGITLPVRAYLRSDFRDDIRIPDPWPSTGCSNVGSDNYYGDATVSATAKMLIFLSLEPRYLITSSGHFVVSLNPLVDFSAEVQSLNIGSLDYHGVSVLSNLYQIMIAPIAEINGQMKVLSDGGDIKTLFNDAKYTTISNFANVAYGALLSEYAIGNPLTTEFARQYAQNAARAKLQDKMASVQSQVLSGLKTKISSALSLDANGRVVYAFDGGFNRVTPTQTDLNELAAYTPPVTPAGISQKTYGAGCWRGCWMAGWTISWGAVPNATYYNVKNLTTGEIRKISGTTYSWEAPQAFSTKFQVQACNAGGCSRLAP